MSEYRNNVAASVTGTPGTGTITLGAALSGAQAFATAYAASATVDLDLRDAAGVWGTERNAVFNRAAGTITRGTPEDGSSGPGVLVSLTSAAVVRVAASAATFQAHDMASLLAMPEVSITTTATATIGVMHVCSGTTADYTVTLPPVAGNTNGLIGFRMAAGLTRLVTLDGNGAELIDGQATRVMWAGEVAILRCDGTAWTKVAGKSIPMTCGMFRAADQSLATGVLALFTLDSVVPGDNNTGRMANTASNRIEVVRSGQYVLNAAASFSALTGRVDCRIHKNAADLWVPSFWSGGSFLLATTSTRVPLVAGDFLQLFVFQSSGSAATVFGNASNSLLSATEVPVW